MRIPAPEKTKVNCSFVKYTLSCGFCMQVLAIIGKTTYNISEGV